MGTYTVPWEDQGPEGGRSHRGPIWREEGSIHSTSCITFSMVSDSYLIGFY